VRSQLLGQWRADLSVCRRDGVMLGTLLVWLVLQSYAMHLATDFVTVQSEPGYYGRQALLATALFGRFAMIVLAAGLAARDGDWGTWSVRLTVATRASVIVGRLSLLACVSLGLTLVGWLPGTALDVLAALDAGPSVNGVAQVGATFATLYFWGCLSFAVAMLGGRFVWGAVGVIGYLLAEMFISGFLPGRILVALPVHDSQVVLAHAFPAVDEGSLGVVVSGSASLGLCVAVAGLYLIAAMTVSVVVLRRREY